MVVATDGYTGADIEQVVIVGLKLAFHAGEELTGDHLRSAIPEVRPLSRTDPERVAAMTAWLERHTKRASNRAGAQVGDKNPRPIVVRGA